MSNDYNQYYQTSNSGLGGLTIDTKWLTKEEFRNLEINFKNWLKTNKPFRGNKQDYEKKIYGDK